LVQPERSSYVCEVLNKFKIRIAPRFLLDERITNPEARKSSEVAVGCPELLGAVLDHERRDMGIMCKVAGGLASPHGPARMGRVRRTLTPKDD